MRVKLATQVFSNTVAAAITAYCSLNRIDGNGLVTADFIKKFNTLFDIFNANTLKNAYQFKRPIRYNWPHFEFLSSIVLCLISIKKKVEFYSALMVG